MCACLTETHRLFLWLDSLVVEHPCQVCSVTSSIHCLTETCKNSTSKSLRPGLSNILQTTGILPLTLRAMNSSRKEVSWANKLLEFAPSQCQINWHKVGFYTIIMCRQTKDLVSRSLGFSNFVEVVQTCSKAGVYSAFIVVTGFSREEQAI